MTSAPKRARALPPEERRAAIIEAALPLIVAHGDSVTSRQIAKAAEVAEGTIFGVFDDKDALIVAVLEQVMGDDTVERTVEAIDPALDFEAQILLATDALHRHLHDLFVLMSGVGPRLRSMASRPAARSEALEAMFARFPDALRTSPDVSARRLRAVVLALTHPMLIADPNEPADPAAIVDFFLHGSVNPARKASS